MKELTNRLLSVILVLTFVINLFSGLSFCSFAYDITVNGPSATASVMVFDRNDGSTYTVFNNNTVKNEVPGMTYERSSNSLVLNSTDGSTFQLVATAMGDDFTIRVNGTCSLQQICLDADSYGASLIISGTGQLTINSNRYVQNGIIIDADRTLGRFTCDKDVKLYIFGSTGESSVVIRDSTLEIAEDVFDFQNGHKAKVYKSDNTIIYDEFKSAVIYKDTHFSGNLLEAKNDPTGIYAVREFTKGDGSTYYEVLKFIYISKYDTYAIDYDYFKGHIREHKSGTLEYAENEWETQTEFTVLTKPAVEGLKVNYYDPDDLGGSYYYSATQVQRVSDPTGIYGITSYYTSDSLGNVEKGYYISRFVYAAAPYNKKLIKDTSFETVKLSEDEFAASEYSVVQGEEPIRFERNKLVETIDIGIYKDGAGEKYAVDDKNDVYSFNENDGIAIGDKFYVYLTKVNVSASTLKKSTISENTYHLDEEFIYRHSYSDDVVNPTCTEEGYTVHICDCGDSFIDTYIPAFGHIPVDEPVKENEVSPTCTKDGSFDEVFYCTVCKQEASRQTKSIAKLGHDMKLIEKVEPTYTSQGYDYLECQRAGCDYHEYIYVPATLASISVSLKEPIRLLEKADASCYLRHNEEEIAQFGDYYYHYYFTLERDGNSITLTSRKGVKDTYTFNEDTGEFTNSNGETIEPEITDTQSSDSPWQVGTNYFTVSYGDKSVQVPVIIEENRVVQVSLIPAKPYVYTQNAEGHWETHGDSPNQHTFFQYDIPEFKNGDLLCVGYKDGDDYYNIDFYYNESESAFISSAGERINKHEICCGFEEEGFSDNWIIGEQNYFYYDYLGVRGYCSVKIRENFVQSISFTPVKPYEYVENCNNISIWDDETETYTKGYLYDDCDIYIEGNKLTVTYKNGSSDDFICKQTDDGLVFANENDEVIYPKSESNQYQTPWTLGSNNFFTVKWSGATASVPVTIVETPVADIEYTPAKPIKLVENFGGHYEGDAFIYEYSPFNAGDEFVVYYKTGASKKYIAKATDNSNKVVFTDAKGNILEGTIWVEDDQHIEPWGVSNYHACKLVYLGVSTSVPVSVVKNHDFVKEVTQPTCTEKGYTRYTCTYCNYSYIGDYVNPLGHDMLFHAGKEETCTQQGNNPYNECTRCHNYYSDNNGESIIADKTSVIIPARGHAFEAVVTAPKATEVGYTQYKCFCGECEKDEAGEVIKDTFTAPTGKLTLKHSVRTANAIKVQWNNVKTATGYQVQISTKDGKKWSTYATLKAGVTNYSFKNLAAGNNYKFRVRFYIKAADGKNYFSPWSATLNSPTLPTCTTLTKLSPSSKAFTAQWKANKTVTGYQIQYSINSKFTGAKTMTVKSNKILKTTVKKLSAKKVYYVRIRTYKTISKVNYFSTWSKAVKVKTK